LSERLTGRHRSSERASTPLTQLTDAVSDQFGDATRTGAIVVISTGLVAGAGLPAQASGPSATSPGVTAVAAPAAPAAAAPAYSAAPVNAAPINAAPARATTAALTAPTTSVVEFESGHFTAIPKPVAAPATATAPVVRRPTVPKVAGTRAVAVRANPVVKARAVTKAKPKPVAKGKPTTATPPKAKPAPAKPKPAPAKPKKPVAKAPATGGVAARGASVISIAARYVGTPYKYGGTTPRGFDCSGFTRYVYKQLGKTIPRTANQQMLATKRVSRSQAKAGDLVFFVSGGRAYHVGIYAGKNMLYDSPRSGKKLSKRKIWDSSVVFGRVR
jgi:cell wall-associated NlpC family hydrolase